MSTPEAFALMIIEKKVHITLGITARQLATIRFDNKSGKVSLNRMEELLTKAGWKKQPERWTKE